MDEAEDRRIRTDAERQSNYSHQRETRVLGQHTQAEVCVLLEPVEPHPAVRFVEALLHARYAAELAMRRLFGFFPAEPLLLQVFDFKLQMRFNLGAKVTLF